MQHRLKDHRDPEYRAKHASLHYFIWDRGNENKMHEVEEKFVVLSATTSQPMDITQNLPKTAPVSPPIDLTRRSPAEIRPNPQGNPNPTSQPMDLAQDLLALKLAEMVDPLLLNLLEMWGCLMLQTLTKNALAKYLPLNMVAPYAGSHLNVAIPLHQVAHCVIPNREDPTMYHSSDPRVAQYYRSLRRRFLRTEIFTKCSSPGLL